MTAQDGARRLRSLFWGEQIVLLPGVSDPWTARLAQQAGFDAVFLTGAGIANAAYGVPDIGLIGFAEMAEAVGRVARSIELPLVADGDTGYGNALNVFHAVNRFRDNGASAMTIEDQVMPKRCGHLAGKNVVPVSEMLEKIAAFQEARGDGEMILIARTDAIAVEGFTAAIDRAQAYVEAGADMIFVEAPTDVDQLRQIPGLVSVPTVINLVEGAKTPMQSLAALQDMGFSAALYANTAIRVAATAIRSAFEVLRREGSTGSLTDAMLSWDDRQALAGLPQWLELEQRVTAAAAALRPDPAPADQVRAIVGHSR